LGFSFTFRKGKTKPKPPLPLEKAEPNLLLTKVEQNFGSATPVPLDLF